MDFKIPVSDVFIKEKGGERLDRAYYFTLAARARGILPMKIVFYVSALECLFTIGTNEISHKVSERIAILLGGNSKNKIELFETIKKTYGIRSKLVHGQYIKNNDEGLVDISKNLDNVLRIIFIKYKDIFMMKDKDMEEYFINLIFDNIDI